MSVTTFQLLMNVQEEYVSTAQYSERFVPRDLLNANATISTDGTTGEREVWVDPVTHTLSLAPRYDVDVDTNVANTTTTSGTWKAVNGMWGTTCDVMHQTDTSAAETSIVMDAAYPVNARLWVDLHFYERAPGGWKAQLFWATDWRLDIYADGQVDLFCKDDEGVYQKRDRGSILPINGSVFGKHIRLGIWHCRTSSVFVSSSELGGDNVATMTRNAPSTAGTEDTDPYTIFKAGAVTLTVASGSYLFGVREVTFPDSGTATYPVATMVELQAEGYTGTPTLELSKGEWLPTGTAVAHSVVDPDGVAFGGGADQCRYRDRLVLTASTDNKSTPQVYWSKVRVPPGYTTPTNSSEDLSVYVQRVSERLSLEDHSHEVSIELKPGEQWTWAPWPQAYGTLAIDGVARTAFYASDPEYTEFEGTYQVKWLQCQNRMKKLKQCVISDKNFYDGQLHTDVVKQLLELAGVTSTDYYIADDPDQRRLQISEENEAPLYQFANGTTVYDVISYICEKHSGWSIHIGGDGTFRYEDLRTTQVATVTMADTSLAIDGGTNKARRKMEFTQRIDASEYYNQIWAIGESVDEEPIVAYWEDQSGWDWSKIIPEAITGPIFNYVGERRKLIYIDPGLQSVQAVEDQRDLLVSLHDWPVLRATLRSYYDPNLRPGQWIKVNPAGGIVANWRIEAISTDIDPDFAFATYELRCMDWGPGRQYMA